METVQEFDGLDRDGSGKLSMLEFAFSEVAQRVRSAGGEHEAVNRVFSKVDRDGDGSIALLEFAQSQHNRNARLLDLSSYKVFTKMDLDQNGLIALAEYSDRVDSKPEAFQRIDLNDSRVIGPFEWVQALRDEFMNSELAVEFAMLDQNDSGAIDQVEFEEGDPSREIADAFEGIDLNGNQELAPQEFAKALASPIGKHGVPDDVLSEFEQLDRNGDQALSRREFGRSEFAQSAPGSRMVDMVFSKSDANDDRELSLSEFGRLPRNGEKGFKGKGKGKGFKR